MFEIIRLRDGDGEVSSCGSTSLQMLNLPYRHSPKLEVRRYLPVWNDFRDSLTLFGKDCVTFQCIRRLTLGQQVCMFRNCTSLSFTALTLLPLRLPLGLGL